MHRSFLQSCNSAFLQLRIIRSAMRFRVTTMMFAAALGVTLTAQQPPQSQLPKGQMPELGRPTKVGDELPLFDFDGYFAGKWTFEWDMPEGPLGESGQRHRHDRLQGRSSRASSTRPTPTPPGPAARSTSTS